MSEITFNPDDFTPEAIRKQRDLYRQNKEWFEPEQRLNNGAPYKFRTTSVPRVDAALVITDGLIDDLLNEPERLKGTLMALAEGQARRTLDEIGHGSSE